MSEIIQDHPSMRSVQYEEANVISVYNGLHIPTGRRRKGRWGYGDIDPPNSRLALLIKDKLDFAELDNEEIAFGIPRCDDGKFSAKAAWQAQVVVPSSVQKKLQAELFRRASAKMSSGLMGAIDSVVELATSAYVEDAVRFKAATWLIERGMGKTPDVVVHEQAKPWEMIIAGVERGPRPQRQVEDGNTIEADVVDEHD